MKFDPQLYRQVVEAWLEPKSISAGYDTSDIGRYGLEGLVSLNTASTLMNLSSAQAKKLRQSVQVFALRTAETSNVVRFLQDDAPEGAPARQIHIGPGFGNALPDASSGGSGATSREPLSADLGGVYIKSALDEALQLSRKAVRDATYVSYLTDQGARTASTAVRTAAEYLRYPGFPAESLPKPPMQPPPSRPRNLAPAALDLPFAMSSGADPYREFQEYPRRNFTRSLSGREVHNPFGYPPLPLPGTLPSGAAVPKGQAGMTAMTTVGGGTASTLQGRDALPRAPGVPEPAGGTAGALGGLGGALKM